MKFTIMPGTDVRPRIEELSEFNDSLFFDVYKNAFSVLNDILDLTKQDRDKDRENQQEKSFQNRMYDIDRYNNIICFTGDRGTGKTSILLSFIKSLPGIQRADKNRSADFSLKGQDSIKFKLLNIIDPSLFTDECNILQVILGQMFTQFKKDVDCRQQTLDPKYIDRKKRLMHSFDQVYKDLSNLESKNCKDDSIDQFVAFASVVSLREKMGMLVCNYLSYWSNGESENNILIVPIDDIDLNMQCAYHMMEQIRKYLMLPNVVVVMAAKLEQLKELCENHFATEYQSKINNDKNHIDMYLHRIADMSERYLLKLLPLSHRVGLPVFEWSDEKTVVVDGNKAGGKSVSQYVLDLILEKTGYLFYDSKSNASPIVPRNLRELVMLIQLLNSMEEKKNGQIPVWNRMQFKLFFQNNWLPMHIGDVDNQFVESLFHIAPEEFCASAILNLKKNVEFLKLALDKDSDYKQIMDEKNIYYNYSVGDLMLLLNRLNNLTMDAKTRNLIFAVKTILSIRLYEAYDRIDFDSIKQSEPVEKSSKLIFKHRLDEFTDYSKLRGISLFNDIEKLLPDDSTSNKPVNLLTVDLNKMKDLEKGDPLFQFLFLTTEFYTTAEYRNNYRKDTNICYKDPLVDFEKVKSVRFNLLSIFNRLLDIYQIMDKYELFWENYVDKYEKGEYEPKGIDLIKYSKAELLIKEMLQSPNSLIGSIMISLVKMRKNVYSVLLLRNTFFIDYIVFNAQTASKGNTKIVSKYLDFFKALVAVNLKVYEKNDMSLSFLQPVVDFFVKKRNEDGNIVEKELAELDIIEEKLRNILIIKQIRGDENIFDLKISQLDVEEVKDLFSIKDGKKSVHIANRYKSFLTALCEKNDIVRDSIQWDKLKRALKSAQKDISSCITNDGSVKMDDLIKILNKVKLTYENPIE